MFSEGEIGQRRDGDVDTNVDNKMSENHCYDFDNVDCCKCSKSFVDFCRCLLCLPVFLLIFVILLVVVSLLSGSRGGAGAGCQGDETDCNKTHTDHLSSSNAGAAQGQGGRGGGGVRGGGRGGGTAGSCFPANEIVELESGPDVPIGQLLPGHVVAEGGTVTAVLKLLFTPEEETMYRYDESVCVTGSHVVLVEAKHNASINSTKAWCRVEESPLAFPDTDAICGSESYFIYNLITDHHRVIINGTIFSDWEEVDPPTDFDSELQLLAQLNAVETSMIQPSMLEAYQLYAGEDLLLKPVQEGAFASGTLVSRHGTGFPSPVPIESIEPGTKIEGGVVVAVMQILITVNELVCLYNGKTIMTGWTIMLDEDIGAWRHVIDTNKSEVLDISSETHEQVFYQLITTSHRLVVDGTVFADYEVV